MSMVQAAFKGLDWVRGPTATGSQGHGLCYHQKPCGDPWSMFSLTVKIKEATFAEILMAEDAQLRGRDMESFCDNPYCPSPNLHPKSQKEQPRPPKRVLQKFDRDAEGPVSTIDAF